MGDLFPSGQGRRVSLGSCDEGEALRKVLPMTSALCPQEGVWIAWTGQRGAEEAKGDFNWLFQDI